VGVQNPVLPSGVVSAWAPTGALCETFDRRSYQNDNLNLLAGGQLYLAGGAVLPAGRTASQVMFGAATAGAVTPTHQWFCIVRRSDLAVLAKTVDDTTTAWAPNTFKTLNLAATLTVPVDTPVYLGVVVTAGTLPTLIGVGPNGTNIGSRPPLLNGGSTAGLTDPASLGANAAALAAVAGIAYGVVF
jgi:hypothetical protein